MSSEVKERPLALLDQQLALGAYLQSLLQVEPQVRETPPVHEAPVVAAPPPAAATEHGPVEPAPVVQGGSNRQWANGRFPCLRFRVAGVTLAVPLERLNGVLPWPEDGVSPMPGHAPWFLGLLRYQGRQVKIIDTAWHVLPADRRQSLSEQGGSGRLRNIVLIDDGQWGLACDGVEEVMQLEPEAVKWRSAKGRRPWLAGTVIAHMCALIDADAFAQVLELGERDPDG